MLAIFNPEHDLCLANGDANYVPPASALRFARQEAHLMKALYGDDTIALAAEDVDWSQITGHRSLVTGHWSLVTIHPQITAWGWNKTLVAQLCKQGVPRELMPSDGQLDEIRRLSHRRTALVAAEACGFSPKGEECLDIDGVQDALARYGRIVLKAPWSGSGRGLRWVDRTLSDLDKSWTEKTLASQGSVMVEPRMEVVQDFALEYYIGGQGREAQPDTHFLGYSLFSTQNGVYRENHLLFDDEILQRLSEYVSVQTILSAKAEAERWLESEIVPHYEGPLGIDMFIYKSADGYALNPMVEINFRHTMGHVAVALRSRTTAATFSPNTL
ncbi:MAG: hypothetical protein K5867_06285 [Bacteroidales bacterium]|nr:hypothetical protein [Bacteroidales bacterium]